jgi:uncharacterized protein YecT (DUF1311 family)
MIHSMKTASCLASAVGFLCGAIAFGVAGAQDFNVPSSPCHSTAGTSDQMACLDRALHAADSQLNDMYTRSLQALLPADRKRLVEAERIWVQYRNASCEAEQDLFEAGTAGPPAELACREAETRSRVMALERAYGWEVLKFGKRGS